MLSSDMTAHVHALIHSNVCRRYTPDVDTITDTMYGTS